MPIQLKTKAQIELMRRANIIVYEVLQCLEEMISPGIATLDLDHKARELCESKGAKPAFLGYPSSAAGVAPFPGVICASPDNVIVHGIPNTQPLKEGSILSVDFGCCYEGFFGDSAATWAVGQISSKAQKLSAVTQQCLEEAIRQCKVGNRIGDISYAVQSFAEKNGFSVVRDFVGHGIGQQMHEPPHVPNFGNRGQGRILKTGMVLAIEPMITEGSFEVNILDDGWTAVTKDAKLAAHFEHTVAITEKGPYVLSRP